jgi:hypothetical protein
MKKAENLGRRTVLRCMLGLGGAVVRGVEAGEDLRRALAQIAPGIRVTVMKPGDTQTIDS